MDTFGNINATEGVSRCRCGSTYWENDLCVGCGTPIEIAEIRQYADDVRLGLRVWMNVLITTHVHHTYGWSDFSCLEPLEDIQANFDAERNPF